VKWSSQASLDGNLLGLNPAYGVSKTRQPTMKVRFQDLFWRGSTGAHLPIPQADGARSTAERNLTKGVERNQHSPEDPADASLTPCQTNSSTAHSSLSKRLDLRD